MNLGNLATCWGMHGFYDKHTQTAKTLCHPERAVTEVCKDPRSLAMVAVIKMCVLMSMLEGHRA